MKLKVTIAALAIAAATIFSSQAEARKISYRGFVDVAGGFPGVAVSTTHGIQLSSKVFTGLGGQASYDFWGEGAGFQVYANFRMDFPSGKRWSPWFSLSPGIDSWGNITGFYGSASGGARYAISNKVGLNMGLTLNFYSAAGVYNGHLPSYESSEYSGFMIGAKFGVDF